MAKQASSLTADSRLYRFSVAIPIRYADIDAQRHLNNVAYFTFMEHARVEYLRELGLWKASDFESIGMILAETACRFTAPAYMGEVATVLARVSHLGNKSFHFQYLLATGRGPIAEGQSIQVCYDYRQQRTIPMPESWRESILAYEPGLDPENLEGQE